MEVYYSPEHQNIIQTETSFYSCNSDGAWLGSREILVRVLEDDTSSEPFKYIYDPPVLVVPAELEEGTAWETTGEVTFVSGPTSFSEEYSIRWESGDEVEITTEAGTFNGLEVSRTEEEEVYSQIIDPDLGLTQDNGWELTGWSR